MEALKQPNGQPFLANSLSRYGYLPNQLEPDPRPAGRLHRNGTGNSTMVGMTCAACHTRQITSGGVQYRIDGGPAIVDFQTFLSDLDIAVNTVLASNAAFTAFANAVLGPSPTPASQAALKTAVQAWFLRYDTLIKNALPNAAVGRRAARRGGDDLQPADRPRSRAAAQLPDRRQHPQGGGTGPLPVPVERVDPGPHAMAGLRARTATPSSGSGAISARSTACLPPSHPRRPGTGSTISM